MSSPRHSRALALVLSLIPGWGHVYLGREKIGLLLFTLVVLSVFAIVNSLLVLEGSWRIWLARPAAGAAAVFWLAGILDVLRLTSPRRLQRIEEQKKELLRSGMISYLKDEMESAESSFRSCLKLDGQEVEALVRLGIVLARSSRPARARSLLRRARALDLEEKWSWEIERELRGLRKPPREAPAAPAPEPASAPAPSRPSVQEVKR
jgi:hypothetical protein